MFKNLTPLDAVKDKELKYKALADFSFARSEVVCPIMFNEFVQAARCFPIVFPDGGTIIPQALLSINKEGNSYVSPEGQWQGAYLPLHLRRYPFVLGQAKDNDKMLIMYDSEAPHFQHKEAESLFSMEDGNLKPTSVLQSIEKYLLNLNKDYIVTRNLFNELKQHDVLIKSALNVKTKDDEAKSYSVKGFTIVDWNKVIKLDDNVLADWTRKGLIQLIHIHLLSIQGIKKSEK